MDDYDAICRVLQLYTEGEAKGDVSKLRQAFHADARMFLLFVVGQSGVSYLALRYSISR